MVILTCPCHIYILTILFVIGFCINLGRGSFAILGMQDSIHCVVVIFTQMWSLYGTELQLILNSYLGILSRSHRVILLRIPHKIDGIRWFNSFQLKRTFGSQASSHNINTTSNIAVESFSSTAPNGLCTDESTSCPAWMAREQHW